MKTASRFLGLAFASADLLLEISGDRTVVFAMGASPAPGADLSKTLSNKPLDTLLCRASRKVVDAVLLAVKPGVRSTPVDILADCGGGRVRRARFSAFQLPDNASVVSCALTWEGPPFALEVPQAPPMLDARGLMNRVRDSLGSAPEPGELAFAFVDVPGLGETADERVQRAAARIEAVLQEASVDGESAARLSPERFALLRDITNERDIAAEIAEAGQAEGVTLTPGSTQIALPGETPGGMVLKALRFALDGCIRDGGAARPETLFSDALRRTMKEADDFRSMVRARQFELQYQPIVDLGTGAAHHFEALARLGGSTGPAATIRMAEELGLIEGFDLAVAEKVVKQLRQPGFGLVKTAVNVSGASLCSDMYVATLLKLTDNDPSMRNRLMIEVTETAAIADLVAANRRIAVLRAAGIKVCLDDFGMGLATWDYIRTLRADFVKIDGGFVRDIETNDRSRTLIRHLVDLCRELDMQSVAEMVETEGQATIIRDLGVGYAQGWLYGKPTAEPVVQRPAAAGTTRRLGEVVGWA
jgi:EAL domain-containing protein (putative c-di-GMP-specific phosphodiesterase class I)